MYSVEEFDSAKTKVLKYILYKRRTEHEVRQMFSNIMQEELLDDVIEYLKEANYIDDKEYINKIVNNLKTLKNLSVKEIKYKLMSKGLNKDYIEDYIYENKEELEEYEKKSAENVISKKIVSMELDDIKKYLQKKGYKQENINEAMEEYE